MSDDCGHYSYLSGRLARLHATQAARGMSASALARLPKVPHLPEPIVLRPVLATKRNSSNFVAQASMLNVWRERNANGRFKPSGDPGGKPKITWANDPNRGNRIQRAKAIISIVAQHGQVEDWQLRQRGGPHRFGLARMVSMHLLRTLESVPVGILAELFEYEDASTPRQFCKKARDRLAAGHPATTDLHDRALAAIKARWPEYDV